MSSQSFKKTLPSQAIIVSDWLIFVNSYLLKPIGQMIRNLVGIIYERTSDKTAHLVPIHYETLTPQAILVSDWSISKNLLL